MFERFTDRARKVMALANQEAQRLNHEYIGTGHILLGLVKEGSGVGATVLKNLDVDIKKLRLEVNKLVKSSPDMVKMGKLPQTQRAKKVIDYAIEEARSLNHNYVGTEHILLGLLRENKSTAAQVFTNLGLKLEDVRQEVLNLLGVGVVWSAQRITGETGLSAKDKETDNNLIKSEQSGLSYKEVMAAEKDVLQGLESVYVFVNPIKPEVEKYSLIEKDLQSDTELQLMQYGIKVLTPEEWGSTTGMLCLWIEVVAQIREEIPDAVASIVVELHENVLLLREPKRVCIIAATWHRGNFWSGGVHSINKIRGHVKDLVSEFTNDYLAANPKETKAKSN